MQNEKASLSTFTITRFRDGDTAEGFVTCRTCGTVHQDCLRILAIESWEIASNDKARADRTAIELTARYRGISGALVPQRQRRDKYGRLLGDVILSEGALSQQLVALGYAWWGVGEPEPKP
jgi:endonuclease YncB( thermonuclease family)